MLLESFSLIDVYTIYFTVEYDWTGFTVEIKNNQSKP